MNNSKILIKYFISACMVGLMFFASSSFGAECMPDSLAETVQKIKDDAQEGLYTIDDLKDVENPTALELEAFKGAIEKVGIAITQSHHPTDIESATNIRYWLTNKEIAFNPETMSDVFHAVAAVKKTEYATERTTLLRKSIKSVPNKWKMRGMVAFKYAGWSFMIWGAYDSGHEIYMARDKVRESTHQAGIWAGMWAGGQAGAYSCLLAGPWVESGCAVVGGFVGAWAGAKMGYVMYDALDHVGVCTVYHNTGATHCSQALKPPMRRLAGGLLDSFEDIDHIEQIAAIDGGVGDSYLACQDGNLVITDYSSATYFNLDNSESITKLTGNVALFPHQSDECAIVNSTHTYEFIINSKDELVGLYDTAENKTICESSDGHFKTLAYRDSCMDHNAAGELIPYSHTNSFSIKVHGGNGGADSGGNGNGDNSVLNPEADSYVQGGAGNNVTHGSEGSLVMRGDEYRSAFLRFSLIENGMLDGFKKATLRVYGEGLPAEQMKARYVSNDAWGEYTITNINKPPGSPTTDRSGVAGENGWVEFDLTTLLKDKIENQHNAVSIQVLVINGTSNNYHINSREASYNRPELIFEEAYYKGDFSFNFGGSSKDGSDCASCNYDNND